jgi:hypothetical protein
VHRVANTAYVSCFLFPGLLRVAPYCVPVGAEWCQKFVDHTWLVPWYSASESEWGEPTRNRSSSPSTTLCDEYWYLDAVLGRKPKTALPSGRCQPLTRHARQEHADLLVGQAVLPGVTLQTRSRASPETSPPKFGSLSLHPPLLKIPIPLGTSRSEPSEGTFCTVTSCSPGSRATGSNRPRHRG